MADDAFPFGRRTGAVSNQKRIDIVEEFDAKAAAAGSLRLHVTRTVAFATACLFGERER
jgi:hypothetical protein